MADEPTGGNTGDSPTPETTDPKASDAEGGGQTGQEAADPQAAGTGEGVEGGEKKTELPDKETLPFDQHPKWQSARKAEQRVGELLEKHGYESIDDLGTAADELGSLKALIGDRDAEQIVKDFEEFQRVKQFWADQEAAKREAEEEPTETIERLKREKQDILDRQRREREDDAAIRESQKIVAEFDDGIRTTVSSLTDISDTDKSMLIEYLGVDNEIATVDPANKVEVKQAVNNAIQRFNTWLRDMKQKAIDDYVAGKSEFTPISKSDTGAGAETVETEEKGLSDGLTVEQFSQKAKDTLLERLSKAAEA